LSEDIVAILTISTIIFTAPFFATWFKISTAPIEIIAGSISVYFGFISDIYIFKLLAEVGFFYLMFLAGTEVDLRILLNTDKVILKKGVLYILLLYLLSFISSKYLGLSNIFIVTMPLISVGLIMSLYNEFGKDTKWLNFSMTVAILGEVVSITVVTFVAAGLEFGLGSELYKAIFYLILFLAILIMLFKMLRILFWWFPGIKVYLMPHSDKDEKDIRLSMAIFFTMIAIMLFLHLEIAFGAFVAGIFIATFFEHKQELPEKLSSFGFGFLIPIFFIYIGSTFSIDSIMMEGLLPKALLISFLMIAVRYLSSFVFIKELGHKNTILLALSHSMPLTLLIAVATIAYNSKSIDTLNYYAFILASIIEVIVVMVFIKLIEYTSQSSQKPSAVKK
jgi:Kef-type K+ transport system membrane component KefB